MAGLSRFDFYPRDWHLDTRCLSNTAKGVYIDLISSMYARGGPLPDDETELCRLCGCKTVRSLRPLLRELIEKEKIRLIDGMLVNNRAMEEIAAAHQRIEAGRKGGKARSAAIRAEYEPNTTGTQAETCGTIEEKQQPNLKLPSPSPPPPYTSSNEDGRLGAPQVVKNHPPGNGKPPDPVKALFDLGVALLTGTGTPEKQARSLVGKWRGQVGDEKLASILMGANRATEPVAYVTKAVKDAARPGCETFI